MNDNVPIGGLTDRVQFVRREMTAEDEGGHVTTFVPIATLWARVTAVGARRAASADGRGVEVTHTVVLRHRSGVKPGDRFVYRGRTLSIVSAEDISGRRAFLACRCTETAVTG